MSTAIELIGGPLDGAEATPHDGHEPAKAGEIINFPATDDPDDLRHLYEVRKDDASKADYLGDGYYGLPKNWKERK